MTLSAQNQASMNPMQDRSQPPETPPLAPFKLPPVFETRLPNGLTVMLVQDNRFPQVTARLAFEAGSKYDPADLPGLAEAAASLLNEGTKKRTSRQIAEELAGIGGAISASAGDDALTLSGNTLSENLPGFLDLLADVALNSTFPSGEIGIYQQNRIQELLFQRSQPDVLAEEKLAQLVFGKHPYSRVLPTPESIQKLNQKTLAAFRDRHLIPNQAVLILLGQLPAQKEMIEMIASRFGAWQEREPPTPPAAEFPAAAKKVMLVDRPGSVQADIRVGQLAIDRKSTQHFPLLVGNTILGGGASSRLFDDIREKSGYAYSVGSVLDRKKTGGAFAMFAQVRNEVLEPALRDALAHLARMGKEPVAAAELTDVKNYMSGNFVMGLETPGGLANQLAVARMMDLPNDYLELYTERIRNVEPDQILKAAGQYINPEKAAIVVVGDAGKLKAALEKFGEVTMEQPQQ